MDHCTKTLTAEFLCLMLKCLYNWHDEPTKLQSETGMNMVLVWGIYNDETSHTLDEELASLQASKWMKSVRQRGRDGLMLGADSFPC